jgi:hypothetical protein
VLNFAEQTGSGAVTVVWSFLLAEFKLNFINFYCAEANSTQNDHTNTQQTIEIRDHDDAVSHHLALDSTPTTILGQEKEP